MPDLPSYLTASLDVMLGKPVFRGTRITLELVLRKVSQGTAVADYIGDVPASAIS